MYEPSYKALWLKPEQIHNRNQYVHHQHHLTNLKIVKSNSLAVQVLRNLTPNPIPHAMKQSELSIYRLRYIIGTVSKAFGNINTKPIWRKEKKLSISIFRYNIGTTSRAFGNINTKPIWGKEKMTSFSFFCVKVVKGNNCLLSIK